MKTQGELFGDPEPETRYEKFKEFHANNPKVYQLFMRFTREARKVRDHFGARMIWERMRWYFAIETDDKEYKLNDHHTPYYPRLAMLEYPAELEGFFETRDAKFDTTLEEMRRDLLDA